MNLPIKLIILLPFINIYKCQKCSDSNEARYCQKPYCCNIEMQCATYSDQCFIAAKNTQPGQCRYPLDAQFCNYYKKCCNKYQDCSDPDDDEDICLVYMNHNCLSDLKCEQCCIMSQEGHYCGTQRECRNIRIAAIVILVLFIIFYTSVLIFCCVGCYKRHKTLELMKKIQERSDKFQANPDYIDNQLFKAPGEH